MSHGPGPQRTDSLKRRDGHVHKLQQDGIRSGNSSEGQHVFWNMDFRDRLAHVLAFAVPHTGCGTAQALLSLGFLICQMPKIIVFTS